MTSVAVVSGAVARIKCLKELRQSSPNESDELLSILQAIQGLLEAGDDGNVELQREIVRLSYDILDVMEDTRSAPKGMLSRTRSWTSKFQKMKEKLKDFHGELTSKKKKNHPRSGEEVSPSSEVPCKKRKLNDESKNMLIRSWKKRNSQVVPSSPDHNSPVSESKEQGKVSTEVDIKKSLSVSNVVYIVGKSGTGKSNLARQLFEDLKVEHGSSFDICAWVPMKQNFQIERVLQVLLENLGPPQDLVGMGVGELINQIDSLLSNESYLLVLDGINWTLGNWRFIQEVLPTAGCTKIIITTSSEDFTKLDHAHRITGMTEPSILNLLEKTANFKPGSEEVGKAIYDASGGSPRLATVLGKSVELDAATPSQQQQFVGELHSYESMKGNPRVLGACYKKLAPELKPCLLYLALFPPGQNIEVEKLYLLLAAENLLLPPKKSQISLPYLIDNNFEALAHRKLVEVEEDIVSTRGNNKSYRLHDQILEFCRFKGLEEEFLQIVELGSSAKVGLHTRRLTIHLSMYKGNNYSIPFNSDDTLKKILSLMIFDTFELAEQKSEWPLEINDLKEFIHLRILNFDGVNFKIRKVPRGLDKLVLLRYLSFRGCHLEVLPSSMDNLTWLETLDLVVHADCKMFIPYKILTKMKRMMHLYFPRLYYTKEKKNVQLQCLERLEILVNLDMDICDVKDLSLFKNLKIISTMSNSNSKALDAIIDFINDRKYMLQHSSVDIRSLDCYNDQSISSLEKLLKCKFVDSIHLQGTISNIPGERSRAEKVADIILDGSQFESDPMNYLGMFENLQSLVLKNDAFLGSEIVIAAAPLFHNLRSLKLQNLRYLKTLKIEIGAMPKLSTLQIDGCSLEEVSIPKEMDDRLKKDRGDERAKAYSIRPLPPKFDITP